MRKALVLAYLIGAVLFLAPAAVAVADDCSTLVEGPLDIVTDELILQDCLRTGQNWGWLIGGTVGGVGFVVALGGLPGRPTVFKEARLKGPPIADRPAKDRSPKKKDSKEAKEKDCQEALDRYNALRSEAEAVRDAFKRRTQDLVRVLEALDIRRTYSRNALEWLAEDFFRLAKLGPSSAWDVWTLGRTRAAAAAVATPGLGALFTKLGSFIGGQRFMATAGSDLPASAISLPASAVCAIAEVVASTLAAEGPEDIGAWLHADTQIKAGDARIRAVQEQLGARRQKEEDVLKSFNRMTSQRRLLVAAYLADIYKSKADMKRLQLEAQEAKHKLKECGLTAGGWPGFPKNEDTTDPIGVEDLHRFGRGHGLSASAE